MPANQPKILTTAWGERGLKNNIPDRRPENGEYGSASYQTGFPDETMTPIASGGKPPSGKDMNGVLHDLSGHIVYQNAGNRYPFNAELAEKIGGYAKGAVVMNDAGDTEYISLVDGNKTNPNSGSLNGKWAIHAGNKLTELAEHAAKKAVPVGAIMGFDKRIVNLTDWLLCSGGRFSSVMYPDLYEALGNSDVLPKLPLSDIGMTAYFPTDEVPHGWIYYDQIHAQVNERSYPHLYAYLVRKYGSIHNVPAIENRFIRNASHGLNVGVTQGDAIRNITGTLPYMDDLSAMYGVKVTEGAFSYELEQARCPEGYRVEPAVRVKFDASRVVPTADENRPKAIAMKLCIKAMDNLDGMNFWIKAKSTAAEMPENTVSGSPVVATTLSGDYEIKPKYINILNGSSFDFAAGESEHGNVLKTPLLDGFFACEWESAGRKFTSTHFAHAGRTQDFNVAVSPSGTPNELHFVVKNRAMWVKNPTNATIKLHSVQILAAQAEFPSKPKAGDDDPEVDTLLKVKADLQKNWQTKLTEIRAEKARIVNLKERDIALVTSHPTGINYEDNGSHINFFYAPMTKGSLLQRYTTVEYMGNQSLINSNNDLIVSVYDISDDEAKEKLRNNERIEINVTFARVDRNEIGKNGYGNAKNIYEAHIYSRTQFYDEYLTRYTQQEAALDEQMQSQMVRIDAQIQRLRNGE